MFDALKEALQRHMKSGKVYRNGEPPVTHQLHDKVDQNAGHASHGDLNDHDEDDKETDHAPNIKPGQEVHQAMKPEVATPADAGVQDQHQKILEALMGQGAHSGREAYSLSEKVADKAKEKYASIAKHKKGY